MSRPIGNRDSPFKRIAANAVGVGNEERKPVLGGFQVYPGTFVAPNDPGNDPPDANMFSPPWLNGFYYNLGAPVWYAHGVDGETDMGGSYDLITGSPVSGTIAFMMQNEWALQAEAYHAFVVLLDNTGSVEDWVYGMAAQIIDPNDSAATLTEVPVRIYWPIYATALP
jgi:hypothetical protein